MKLKSLVFAVSAFTSIHAGAKGTTVKLSEVAGKTPLINTITASVAGQTMKILTDDKGISIYTFELDSKDTSVCKADCLIEWPPVHVPANSRVELPFAQIKGNDGQAQLTLNGFPLYHYDDDKKPGDTFGQYPKWNVIAVVEEMAGEKK